MFVNFTLILKLQYQHIIWTAEHECYVESYNLYVSKTKTTHTGVASS